MISLLDGRHDQFAVLAHDLQVGLEHPHGFLRELGVVAIATQVFNDDHLLPNDTFGLRDVFIGNRPMSAFAWRSRSRCRR